MSEIRWLCTICMVFMGILTALTLVTGKIRWLWPFEYIYAKQERGCTVDKRKMGKKETDVRNARRYALFRLIFWAAGTALFLLYCGRKSAQSIGSVQDSIVCAAFFGLTSVMAEHFF